MSFSACRPSMRDPAAAPRSASLIQVRMPDGTLVSIPAIDGPAQADEILQSWDCSFKGLETSDYVVGQVWGRVGSRFLLGHQVRARMDLPATVKAVRDLTERSPHAIT